MLEITENQDAIIRVATTEWFLAVLESSKHEIQFIWGTLLQGVNRIHQSIREETIVGEDA